MRGIYPNSCTKDNIRKILHYEPICVRLFFFIREIEINLKGKNMCMKVSQLNKEDFIKRLYMLMLMAVSVSMPM